MAAGSSDTPVAIANAIAVAVAVAVTVAVAIAVAVASTSMLGDSAESRAISAACIVTGGGSR